MIIVGVGANLEHPVYGTPRETCGRALDALAQHQDISIVKCSRWYQSAPVFRDGNPSETGAEHPWYVNAAISVHTRQTPAELLDALMVVESMFGRVRSVDDAPRTIDLDIVAFNDLVVETEKLTIPHPRLAQRAFVVLPVQDLSAHWVHPKTGQSVNVLRELLPPDQDIEAMPDAPGLFGTEWAGDKGN